MRDQRTEETSRESWKECFRSGACRPGSYRDTEQKRSTDGCYTCLETYKNLTRPEPRPTRVAGDKCRESAWETEQQPASCGTGELIPLGLPWVLDLLRFS